MIFLGLLPGLTLQAQELPQKSAKGEPPPNPELFLNPPIDLSSKEEKPAPVRTTGLVKEGLIEAQRANVQKLEAQVERLRKRLITDPQARELLIGAQAALLNARQLVADAENIRLRNAQADAIARRNKTIPDGPAQPTVITAEAPPPVAPEAVKPEAGAKPTPVIPEPPAPAPPVKPSAEDPPKSAPAAGERKP